MYVIFKATVPKGPGDFLRNVLHQKGSLSVECLRKVMRGKNKSNMKSKFRKQMLKNPIKEIHTMHKLIVILLGRKWE